MPTLKIKNTALNTNHTKVKQWQDILDGVVVFLINRQKLCKYTTHDNNKTEFKLTNKITKIAKVVGDVARCAKHYVQPILLRIIVSRL